MNIFNIAVKTFTHYLRQNLVLAMGVAAATAVFAGALVVGDSMRTSLRDLALDRLGRIDELIVSDGFFRSELASEIASLDSFSESYSTAEPAILFPSGSVETGTEFTATGESNLRRVSNVAVFGIEHSFWSLADESFETPEQITGRQVIINQTLADQLGADSLNERPILLTLRIPKPTQLPSDSSLGRKNDLVESLVELEVVDVVPDKSVGRFSLHPSQIDSPNVFLSIELIQEALAEGALKHKSEPQSNVIFLAGKDGPHSVDKSQRLMAAVRPSLSDLGLNLKHVVQKQEGAEKNVFEYYSLSSDRLVLSDDIVDLVQNKFPKAAQVFTYLANDIRVAARESGIPFSMVSAVNLGADLPLLDLDGQSISTPASDQIVLNEWAANDLDLKVGDQVVLTFFEPEAAHGNGVEREAKFTVSSIAKLTAPDSPFQVRRRTVFPAVFETNSPTFANDPDLTPIVPGLTDAESIEKWDLPFATADKIRGEDDDYWNDYRTTPKAFIALERGRLLWRSRFGQTTSFRIPIDSGSETEVGKKLLDQFEAANSRPGFTSIAVKRTALSSSSGSTPFDILFLALSMFVIASALILVSLLFRLTLTSRASEIGTLLATGFQRSAVSKLLLIEMLIVTVLGVVLGLVLGVAYAAIMIFGLRTWWIGAISKPIIQLHISPTTLAIGAVCGLLVCLLTIGLTVRATRKKSIRQLLSGELEGTGSRASKRRGWAKPVILLLAMSAVALSVVAGLLGGEPQAGAFMGAGFLVLAAALLAVYVYLTQSANQKSAQINLSSLASMSGKRNPLRSTLTIGLVAVASFLIVAVSSFRLSPTDEGTGGFELIAKSDRPVFQRLESQIDQKVDSFSIRLKAGEDASCSNLYQSTQPQVLGVTQEFIDSFELTDTKFRWASKVAGDSVSPSNPWTLLNMEVEGGAIPVVIDKNTANYSLKIFATGCDYTVEFDSGEKVTFRVVGFLENSILQGSLIVSEERFVELFPDVAGYRMFLVKSRSGTSTGSSEIDEISAALESRFSDQGLDASSARERLAQLQQVQNTYISTFQTLGALGLLLGTFGLAVVQVRSVLERQQELGLMRAVGFGLGQLSRLILLENVWLLLAGLIVGVGSALVTTLPHYFFGGASVPWAELAVLFLLISIFGLGAATLASRMIARMPLIESLRA